MGLCVANLRRGTVETFSSRNSDILSLKALLFHDGFEALKRETEKRYHAYRKGELLNTHPKANEQNTLERGRKLSDFRQECDGGCVAVNNLKQIAKERCEELTNLKQEAEDRCLELHGKVFGLTSRAVHAEGALEEARQQLQEAKAQAAEARVQVAKGQPEVSRIKDVVAEIASLEQKADDRCGEVMRKVSEVDIAERVAARPKEAEQKDRKRLKKQEANLFTFIKISTEENFEEQIGKDRWFDLVDLEKVQVLRVKKEAIFADVKDQIAGALNVPVQNMRFWHWTMRSNNTYRPSRPLTPQEEDIRVGSIRDLYYPAVYQPKNSPTILHLFLEIPGPSESLPLLPTRGTYLMFFKIYNPAKQSLLYAGRLFLPLSCTRAQLEANFKKLTGMPVSTALEVYEEIKIDPAFMVDAVPHGVPLQNNQNQDGDIFIIQEAVSREGEKSFKFPHAPGFLKYLKNRQIVTFRKLENPKEEGMSMELSKADTYDTVSERLAEKLKLEDPECLRFTQHNPYTQFPKPSPLRFRQHDTLVNMLSQFNTMSDILYYEALDMPLPDVERLKSPAG